MAAIHLGGDRDPGKRVAVPCIELIHVIAIVLVVGTISIVDLRLMGLASRERPVNQLTHDLLPFTWGAFIVAAIAGALLFSLKADAYAR